jgi:hypothetical protein
MVVCPTEQSVFVAAPKPTSGLASPDVDDIVRETARPAAVFTVEAVGLLAAAIAAGHVPLLLCHAAVLMFGVGTAR